MGVGGLILDFLPEVMINLIELVIFSSFICNWQPVYVEKNNEWMGF